MNLENTHHITLDFSIPKIQNIRCVENDKDSHIIQITVTNNGGVYPLDSNTMEVMYKIHKPDHKYIYNYIPINNGTVTISLSEQAVNVPGLCPSELQIIEKTSGKILSTMPFNIIVERSVVNAKDIESANESNVINGMLNHLNNYSNPHKLTKSQIGLGNADNTSDIDKPVSTAQQAAIHSAVSAHNSSSAVHSDIRNLIENINTNKVDKISGKGLSANDYTTAEKNKLSGIAAGAEVNQNTFSNISVDSTTISADSKTDTLTLAAGSNITITPDAQNDKITISSSGSDLETLFYETFSPYFIYSETGGDIITNGGRGGTRASSEPAFYGVMKYGNGNYPYSGFIIGLTEDAVKLNNLTQYGTNTIIKTPDGFWINRINTTGMWSDNRGCEVKRGNSTLKTYAVMTTDTVAGTTLKDLAKSLAAENKSLETDEKGSVFGAINELKNSCAKKTEKFIYETIIREKLDAGHKIAVPMTEFKRVSDNANIAELYGSREINGILYASKAQIDNIKNIYTISDIADRSEDAFLGNPIKNPILGNYVSNPFWDNHGWNAAQIILYFPEGFYYTGFGLSVDVYMELEL